MLGRLAAGFALAALLPVLAFAGPTITKFSQPKPSAMRLLGADSLPIPEHAAALSARSTFVPLGVGTAMCAVAWIGVWSSSNDLGPAGGGLFVVGLAVATTGMVVGPSAGYSYGGLSSRGSAGVLARLGLLLAPPVVLAMQPSVRDSDEGGLAVAVGILVGAGLVTIEAVYDVAAVEGSVRRHNATLTRPTSWRLEPCATPSTHAPGLALRAGFGGPAGS